MNDIKLNIVITINLNKMKKYYFKIGLCALLIFAHACQKVDKQENKSAKTEEKANIPTEKENTNAQNPQSNQNLQPFITSNGDLYLPLERQGNAAQQKTFNSATLKSAAVFETLEPSKNETFFVQNDEPQAIELSKGTKIYIPDNAFVLAETGELVTGEVKIEAKEVQSISECLKRGVTTMSNAGLLESGGMLYVGATYEGKKCNLQKGKELDVEMPTWGEKKQGMKLFSGEKNADGKIEWAEVTENQINPTPPENVWKKYYENCHFSISSVDSLEEFIIHHQNNRNDLDLNFGTVLFQLLPNNGVGKEDVANDIPKKFFKLTGKTINYLAKTRNDYELRKDTLRLNVNINQIDQTGKVLDWATSGMAYFSNKVSYKESFYYQLAVMLKKRKWKKTGEVSFEVYIPKKAIPKLRKMFPAYKDIAAMKEKYKSDYTQYYEEASATNRNNKEYNNSEYCQKYRKLAEAEAAERQRKYNEEHELELTSRYAFKTARLGWINCDRFVTEPKTQLALELGDF